MWESFAGKVGWDSIKAIFNYYGLRDYFSFVYCETFDPDKITEIYAYNNDDRESGEHYFWKNIITGKLLQGDKVRLRNFQISPWFPRRPGLYWTYNAALARRKAWLNHVKKVENGVVYLINGGKL